MKFYQGYTYEEARKLEMNNPPRTSIEEAAADVGTSFENMTQSHGSYYDDILQVGIAVINI